MQSFKINRLVLHTPWHCCTKRAAVHHVVRWHDSVQRVGFITDRLVNRLNSTNKQMETHIQRYDHCTTENAGGEGAERNWKL